MPSIGSLMDSGYTYDEILNKGLATTFDLEDYESSFEIQELKSSLPEEKRSKEEQFDPSEEF